MLTEVANRIKPRRVANYRIQLTHVQDIEDDTGGQPSVYPNQALYAVLQEMGDNRDKANDIKIEIKIFLDENSQAFPGYFVR